MSVLNFFNSQQRSLLGIDISSTSVKILEISHSSDRYCVEGYAIAALPEGAMDGVLVKDVDVVAGTIKNLLTTTHFTSKHAACAVPESSAISKIIQLDASLSTYEMEELVISEADKYIPYPIDEINIDFNVIQLNHYKCKTLPEFQYIRTRQRADIPGDMNEDVLESFNKYNINEVRDLTAYYFYHSIK